MKRTFKSGFTMVELIFVIIVIGILSAVALPRFVGITESSKVNSELSTMDNLAGSLEWSKQAYVDTATPEWSGGKDGDRSTFDFDADGYEELYVNGKLANLHFMNTNESADYATRTAAAGGLYSIANTQGTLFNKISKAGGKGMRVVATWNPDGTTNGDDVLIMTGQASDTVAGVDYPTVEVAGATQDSRNKPDRNDVWVFNGKNYAITVTVPNAIDGDVSVSAYSLKLIDVGGTNPTVVGDITVNTEGVTPIL